MPVNFGNRYSETETGECLCEVYWSLLRRSENDQA